MLYFCIDVDRYIKTNKIMKTARLLSTLTFLALACFINLSAQEAATKKEFKKVQKQEKVLKKDLEQKAMKDARTEAKKFKKDGYKTPAGKLPIDKQLETAWMKQVEIDADGYPINYVATQRAIGGSFSSAQMQATNLAKMDLAGQIQTKVSQMVEGQIANSELGKEEAATVTNVVAASKSVISANLGRTVPVVEMYKDLDNGNVEVVVTLVYSTKMATKAAIQAVQNELAKKSDALAKELNTLVE